MWNFGTLQRLRCSIDHRDVLGRRCDGGSMQAPSIFFSTWHKFYRLRDASVQRQVPFLSRRLAGRPRTAHQICSSNLSGIRGPSVLAAQLIESNMNDCAALEAECRNLPVGSVVCTLTRFRRRFVNGCGYFRGFLPGASPSGNATSNCCIRRDETR